MLVILIENPLAIEEPFSYIFLVISLRKERKTVDSGN